MYFIKINVPVGIKGGGEYPAGVIVEANGNRTNPYLVTTLTFYRSQEDYENGESKVSLLDIEDSVIMQRDEPFVAEASVTNIGEYLVIGLNIIRAWLEDNDAVGADNTELVEIERR